MPPNHGNTQNSTQPPPPPPPPPRPPSHHNEHDDDKTVFVVTATVEKQMNVYWDRIERTEERDFHGQERGEQKKAPDRWVIVGSIVNFGENPGSLVSIMAGSREFCLGVLIKPDLIVTTASCLKRYEPDQILLEFGKSDFRRSSSDDMGFLTRPLKVFRAPNYVTYQDPSSNIAILKISPAPNHFRPARILNSAPYHDSNHNRAYGFGTLSRYPESLGELREASLRCISRKDWNDHETNDRKGFCCTEFLHHDEGTPLFIESGEGQFSLLAILSDPYSRHCPRFSTQYVGLADNWDFLGPFMERSNEERPRPPNPNNNINEGWNSYPSHHIQANKELYYLRDSYTYFFGVFFFVMFFLIGLLIIWVLFCKPMPPAKEKRKKKKNNPEDIYPIMQERVRAVSVPVFIDNPRN